MLHSNANSLPAAPYAAKLISRAKRDGIGNHYGVLLADQSVIEFDPSGVNVTNLRAFASGASVYAHAIAPREALSSILQRAHSALKQDIPYRLIDSNCEHFARWLIGLPRESKQISFVALLALVAAVLYSVN
jgi:hypothetical protein